MLSVGFADVTDWRTVDLVVKKVKHCYFTTVTTKVKTCLLTVGFTA